MSTFPSLAVESWTWKSSRVPKRLWRKQSTKGRARFPTLVPKILSPLRFLHIYDINFVLCLWCCNSILFQSPLSVTCTPVTKDLPTRICRYNSWSSSIVDRKQWGYALCKFAGFPAAGFCWSGLFNMARSAAGAMHEIPPREQKPEPSPRMVGCFSWTIWDPPQKGVINPCWFAHVNTWSVHIRSQKQSKFIMPAQKNEKNSENWLRAIMSSKLALGTWTWICVICTWISVERSNCVQIAFNCIQLRSDLCKNNVKITFFFQVFLDLFGTIPKLSIFLENCSKNQLIRCFVLNFWMDRSKLWFDPWHANCLCAKETHRTWEIWTCDNIIAWIHR